MSDDSNPVKDGGPEDLSIRARRFGLSLAEERALDRACEASPALRLSHEVGRDFDRIAMVRAGDEELIARAADRVLTLSHPRRRRSRWPWGVGVAVTLLSSGAFAWWSGALHAPASVIERTVPTATLPPPSAPRVPASAAGERPAQEHAEEAILDRAPEARSPHDPRADELQEPGDSLHGGQPTARASAHGRRASVPVRAAASSEPIAAIDGDNAQDWFRKANAARRDGDLAAASALYAGLQAKFPSSDEARLSHVSLGKLLLSSGRTADAEKQFSLYIAAGGRELAEEALVGRAQSLQRLGRAGEERQTWQTLLRDAPAGIYAARAKQRLDELASGVPPSR